jgi:hypothetical protein
MNVAMLARAWSACYEFSSFPPSGDGSYDCQQSRIDLGRIVRFVVEFAYLALAEMTLFDDSREASRNCKEAFTR